MGLFCANFHFRTPDDQALTAALTKRRITKYRVAPAMNGWVSLYEERASEQDDDRIRDLAGKLSKDLHVAGIAFMVHDSDIACYWLYDDGRLLDEFNSYPNYFDESDGPPTPAGGKTDIFVRYCKPGVTEDDLAAILSGENLFAENVIEQLADALGIDHARAIADYRSDGGDRSDESDDEDDDNEDDDHGGSPQSPKLAGQLARMFGIDPNAVADPQVTALVQAAVDDDIDAIDRLLAAGTAIDAEAPAPLPGPSTAGLGQFVPGDPPKVTMTPLLAAVANKRNQATKRLLAAGADPNHTHQLFGTATHAATAAGDADLLHLLIDGGADVNARNVRGQTPMQVLAAARTSLDQLIKTQAMMKSMGMTLPGAFELLSSGMLPTDAWDACERLLKSKNAQ